MAQNYNWQLGREMEYPYETAVPDRQFAFVINTNRCIGCQNCTMACKSTWTFSKGQEHMWWTNVETKPYGGYPQNWDLKTLALLEKNNPGEKSHRQEGKTDSRTKTSSALASCNRKGRPETSSVGRSTGYPREDIRIGFTHYRKRPGSEITGKAFAFD